MISPSPGCGPRGILGAGRRGRPNASHCAFFRAVPLPEGTVFESLTEAVCGFNVAGPEARNLLQRLTDADLSKRRLFPVLSGRNGSRWRASRSWRSASAFTGDLGWELHCAEVDQLTLLRGASGGGQGGRGGPRGQPGADVAFFIFFFFCGWKKAYGSWGRDYSPEYWPQESGLDGLISA